MSTATRTPAPLAPGLSPGWSLALGILLVIAGVVALLFPVMAAVAGLDHREVGDRLADETAQAFLQLVRLEIRALRLTRGWSAASERGCGVVHGDVRHAAVAGVALRDASATAMRATPQVMIWKPTR